MCVCTFTFIRVCARFESPTRRLSKNTCISAEFQIELYHTAKHTRHTHQHIRSCHGACSLLTNDAEYSFCPRFCISSSCPSHTYALSVAHSRLNRRCQAWSCLLRLFLRHFASTQTPVTQSIFNCHIQKTYIFPSQW